MLAQSGPQKAVLIVSGLGERLNPTFGSTGQATGTRSTGDHRRRSSPAVLSANESHNSKFQRNILVGVPQCPAVHVQLRIGNAVSDAAGVGCPTYDPSAFALRGDSSYG